MSTYSIMQKRFTIIAILGVVLLVMVSCTAPNNLAVEPADTASSVDTPTMDRDATDSAPGNTEAELSEEKSEEATEEEATEAEPDVSTASTTEAVADADALQFEGMQVGFTDEGYVYRGNPDAPITIYEYSDYQCPFCQRHFYQTEPGLNEEYVNSGQVRFVFVDFPLTQIHPNAPAASAAALCAADQSPVEFWRMHHRIFETQGDWGSAPDPLAAMSALAEELDLDMALFRSCLAGGSKDALISESVSAAQQLGFGGTPSFQFVVEESGESYQLVGAQPYEKFADWIDTLAAGEVPLDAQPEPEPAAGQGEIPYWATADGLAPDPSNAGYTVAGDPYRGSEDAKVIVIEFSDFQCPFCGRHTSQTQPVLDEQFVDTGDVRWVFKHFPLNIHAQAPAAGVAAECAGNQGEFWRMHEELFAGMASWSISDPNPVFVDIATSMNLDTDAFEECLQDETIRARVDSDFEAGRQFVQGTPTFIVMAGEEGRIIPGALPAEQFTEALQQVLDSAQ